MRFFNIAAKLKEKIYSYIKERDQGVPPQEISEKFFHVLGQYPPGMDRIIESILQDDPRFVRDEIGEWHVQKKHVEPSLAEVEFSIAEIESLLIDSK